MLGLEKMEEFLEDKRVRFQREKPVNSDVIINPQIIQVYAHLLSSLFSSPFLLSQMLLQTFQAMIYPLRCFCMLAFK